MVQLHCFHLTPSFPTTPSIASNPTHPVSPSSPNLFRPHPLPIHSDQLISSSTYQLLSSEPCTNTWQETTSGRKSLFELTAQEIQPTMVEKAWQPENKEAGHTVSTAGELWEIKASAQLAFSFWHDPGVSAHGRMCCFWCESSYLLKLFWKHPHSYTQKCFSRVILNPIRLIGWSNIV